jgi:hypothetical protein
MTNDIDTAPKAVENIQEEKLEIVFDFSRVDLMDFLDMIEISARKESGDEIKAEDTVKFVRMLRTAYVSSSRRLTVADFNYTVDTFWKNAEIFKNPNA